MPKLKNTQQLSIFNFKIALRCTFQNVLYCQKYQVFDANNNFFLAYAF